MFCTGYSLRAPSSQNPREFLYNLENKVDMTTETRRYPVGYKDLPPCTGTIPETDKFDNDFFKFSKIQTDKMDAGIRILLEVAHEALMDANVDIASLRGSNTGVYVGHCFSDFFAKSKYDDTTTGYEIVNGAHAMAANKISYFYDLRGPSIVFDTACSSGLVALNQAVNDMRLGIIDRAIVGGISLTLDPTINTLFNAFHMLSPTGKCYSFDDKANGYCRSEGIVAIILERDTVCDTGICRVLGTSVNSDGHKAKGITFPSGMQQCENAKKAFEIAKITPHEISYVEAHGTGTNAGDTQELGGFMKLFYESREPTEQGTYGSPATPPFPEQGGCRGDLRHKAQMNASRSSSPPAPRHIPIGSVKSNMGHAEGASGLMSMVKCMAMYETKKTLPNLHFEKCSHEPINGGYFRVITEREDWTPGNVCISNYGFGGTNAFAILGAVNNTRIDKHRYNENTFANVGNLRWREPTVPFQTLPPESRGVAGVPTSSGIYTEGVRACAVGADDRTSGQAAPCYGFDASNWFGQQIALGNDADYKYKNANKTKTKPTIAFVYGGQGSQWTNMGKELFGTHPIFTDTIERLDAYLRDYDSEISLVELYRDGSKWMDKKYSVIGITSYQIAMTNILEDAGIYPDHFFGHSLGESAAAYASYDKQGTRLQTEKQCIGLAYIRSQLSCMLLTDKKILKTTHSYDFSILNTSTKYNYYYVSSDYEHKSGETLYDLDGEMVAAGLPADVLNDRITQLGLTETCVACYNSPNGQTVSGSKTEIAKLKASLSVDFPELFWKSIPTDNVAYHAPHLSCHYEWLCDQFAKIIGTDSVPVPERWISTCNTQIFDHRYHANNIVSPVFFQQAIEKLPVNTLVIEVGSSSSLLGQIKRVRTDISVLELIKVFKPATETIDIVRTIWENGYSWKTATNERPVRLPISQRIYNELWNHSETHRTMTYKDFESRNTASVAVKYNVEKEDKYLLDHTINGRSLFPATGHLYTAWKVLGLENAVNFSEFEICAAVVLDPVSEPIVSFDVSVGERIVISHSGQVVARVSFAIKEVKHNSVPSSTEMKLTNGDIYNNFKRYGYEYKPEFRLLADKTLPDADQISCGTLKSTTHIIAYLDCVLQMFLNNVSGLMLPVMIRKVSLHPRVFEDIRGQSAVFVNYNTQVVATASVSMTELITSLASGIVHPKLRHDAQIFVPYGSEDTNMEIVREIVLNETLGTFIRVNGDSLKTVFGNDAAYGAAEKYDVIVGTDDMDKLRDGGFAIIVSEPPSGMTRIVGNLFRKISHNTKSVVISSWREINPHISQLYVDGGSHAFLKSYIKETGNDTLRAVCGVSQISDLERELIDTYNMRFNAFENGKLGCYARVVARTTTPPQLPVREGGVRGETVGCPRLLHITKPGDLESLCWNECEQTDTSISYSALNFKDVMYSFGKLKLKTPSFGLEFSGIHTTTGNRIMGITNSNGIATHTTPSITWPVPDEMSLEDAATIPVVYCTSLYALFEKANLKAGQTVLIHAGTGGIGHAAIHLCQKRGINVLTTCAPNKVEYIMNYFGIPREKIGNSRDTSFREMVLTQTGGRGVDCVLNSLSGDMLVASMEIVAEYGNFCEIGKYDLENNTKIGLKAFEKNVSYHAIELGMMFTQPQMAVRLRDLLSTAMAEGIVRPLPHDIFSANKCADALRYLSSGKHRGKVLIRMSDLSPNTVVRPKYKTHGTHIITGGLGGFGMELGKWLQTQGAETIVLTTRSGIKTARQQANVGNLRSGGNLRFPPATPFPYRELTEQGQPTVEGTLDSLPLTATRSDATQSQNPPLQGTYGAGGSCAGGAYDREAVKQGGLAPSAHMTACAVKQSPCHIETHDVGNDAECRELIQKYETDLVCVWHVATVLEDAMFSNMTESKWQSLYNVKVDAMRNLDKYVKNARIVCFSSISSMIGNVGQTNYASANNHAEMIIRERVARTGDGLAIQWGAIDNVGLMMAENMKDGFTSSFCDYQNIDTSLDSLHYLMTQRGVVSSYLEKAKETGATETKDVDCEVIKQLFVRILGGTVDNYDTITEVGNFGLDSLSSVEVVNWINRYVSVKVSPPFLAHITIEGINTYIQKNKL